MTDALTQQQLAELSEKHQVYQYQAESIAQQINMVKLTIKDVETALTTITALKNEPAGKETLVPIGFGSFVKATLAEPDKVVVGIGAGVSVEKKIDDAKSFLEKRKDELTKYHEQLNSTIAKLVQELQNIQKLVQKHQQAQQSGQPMRAQ
ncbi:MAG: prefoldin subunit alpha [Candidatus Methanoperedenaceae archaeon]|nr:prefoldin subunit alpha [Euryarchaeota archaeon]MCG2727321.1 prefoldin subunit alpha [Candidatus Methanoperedenaceae archaeon]